MNILPLLFSFLIIMALVTSTLLRKNSSTKQEARALFCLLQAEANSRTLQARDKMKKIPKKQTQAEKNAVKAQVPKSFSSTDTFPDRNKPKTVDEKGRYFRNTKCPHKGRQLFIGNLITAPEKASLVYDASLKLLKMLYGNKPFWQEAHIPNLEVKILDALIESKGKASYNLVEKQDGLGEIFYKILKGTNTYDQTTGEGIPPFFDFFDIEEKGKWFVYFNTASRPVLEAYLGPELTSLIEKEERAKGTSLTKEELISLVQKHPTFFDPNHVDKIFYFQEPNTTAITSIHTTTGISYR